MFSDLQIRSKLVAMLVLPLVGLILFASWQVWNSNQSRTSADRLNRATELSAGVTGLVDALQRERSLSSGYVAAHAGALSGPARLQQQNAYQPLMLSARAETDELLGGTRTALTDFNTSDFSERIQTDVPNAVRVLENVAVAREEIDQQPPTRARVLTVYTETIGALQSVVADVAQEPGADQLGDRPTALAQLSLAKEAAAEGQAVLLSALVSTEYSTSEFQRFATLAGTEDAAIQQFLASAEQAQAGFFRSTVTGTEVNLTRLMQAAGLSGPDSLRGLSDRTWLNASGGRLERLRQVEQRLSNDVAQASVDARDAAVRAATLASVAAIALAALTVLLSGLLARSMVNPITALERTAREVAEHRLPEVVERLQSPDAEEADLAAITDESRIPVQSKDEIGRLATAFHTVQQVAVRVAAEQAALRRSINDMFVNLARRNQTLIDRQLNLIEELERDTEDPNEMAELFRLDHLATRMRRNQENLLVLASAEPAKRWSDPIPLAHLLRAASAEVEDFTRVELLTNDDAMVVGYATSDVVHLLAELIENATMFSPPHTPVRIATQAAANGYLIEIEDQGTGMNDKDLLSANERLAVPPEIDFALSRRLGFFVVGRLAKRHGIRVQLRHSWYGGVTALVLIPESLFLPGTIATPVGAVASRRAAGAAAELQSVSGPVSLTGLGSPSGRIQSPSGRFITALGGNGAGDRPGKEGAGGRRDLSALLANSGLQPAGDRTQAPADQPAFTPRISNNARIPRLGTPPHHPAASHGAPPPTPDMTGPGRHTHEDPPHLRQGTERRDPLAGYQAGLVQGRLADDLEAPPPLSPPTSQFRRGDEDHS